MEPTERILNPFDPSPVREIPLKETPLATVLFQVRFPLPLVALQRAISDGSIQKALGDEFPFAQSQPVFDLVVQPGHPPQQKPTDAMALMMLDRTQSWSLNLSQDSFSLTTSRYGSRSDFADRAVKIFEAVRDTVNPPAASRLGVRYINRVVGRAQIQALAPGLTPEAQSILQLWLESPAGAIQHSMNDLLHVWPGSQKKIQARWGILPAGVVVDGSLQPADEPSWVLDIDAFDEQSREFDPGILTNDLKDLAARAYRFFRWMITPTGLKEFGATE